ncbi:histidine phosphatase family protein [Alphaproteobacteria bacterium]|nr:histidine phosphatase family protein [Alphaproteobacteria bacterium]
MAELFLARHGQASFGSDNYDALSDVGWEQCRLLGHDFKKQGITFDRIVIGSMVRHRQSFEGIQEGLGGDVGTDVSAEIHDGFNEYDFHSLLKAHFNGKAPSDVMEDRKTHFRTLREVLSLWQKDEVIDPPESWVAFKTRIARAVKSACRQGAKRVLVVSSGGPTGQIVASALDAPEDMMIKLNLQVKNSSYSRFVFNEKAFYLNGFNATPHLDDASVSHLLTYS